MAEGKAAVAETNTIDGIVYSYTVGDSNVNVNTSVSAGEPSVNVPADSGIEGDALKAALTSEDTAVSMAYAAVNLSNDAAVVGT